MILGFLRDQSSIKKVVGKCLSMPVQTPRWGISGPDKADDRAFGIPRRCHGRQGARFRPGRYPLACDPGIWSATTTNLSAQAGDCKGPA
jgi:hypothetical protein